MAEKREWKDLNRREKMIAIILMCVIALVFFKIFFSTNDNKSVASYSSSVISYLVVDPATVKVQVHVKNTGASAASPTCRINVSNDTGVYSGFDSFTLEILQPNQEKNFSGNITVTKEGASYITQTKIECS